MTEVTILPQALIHVQGLSRSGGNDTSKQKGEETSVSTTFRISHFRICNMYT